jgi:hypothetical protein
MSPTHYQYITHPVNGRIFHISQPQSHTILKRYLKQFGGGPTKGMRHLAEVRIYQQNGEGYITKMFPLKTTFHEILDYFKRFLVEQYRTDLTKHKPLTLIEPNTTLDNTIYNYCNRPNDPLYKIINMGYRGQGNNYLNVKVSALSKKSKGFFR